MQEPNHDGEIGIGISIVGKPLMCAFVIIPAGISKIIVLLTGQESRSKALNQALTIYGNKCNLSRRVTVPKLLCCGENFCPYS